MKLHELAHLLKDGKAIRRASWEGELESIVANSIGELVYEDGGPHYMVDVEDLLADDWYSVDA